MTNLETFVLKLPRNNEITPEATKTFLSALISANKISNLDKLFGKSVKPIALEIFAFNQQIHFAITADESLLPFIQTQLQSNYPTIIMEKINDPLINQNVAIKDLKLTRGNFYPIQTYEKFTDIDPMSSILSVLSKVELNEVSFLQIALQSIKQKWQQEGSSYAEFGTKNEDGTYSPRSDKNIVNEKISYPGFKVGIRIGSTSNKTLNELISTFGVFSRSDGNTLAPQKHNFLTKNKYIQKAFSRIASGNYILNTQEISTIWHLPSQKIKVSNIVWGTSVLSESPDNISTALNTVTEEERMKVNFFAKTVHKNKDTIFGIKDKDRRRHVWSIGKTGTGKSTLIANMAIDDLKKDRGVAVIDPHGDLTEVLLDYVPKRRINDVVYFNPADKDFPITINPLEVTNREEAELVTSGLMAIFTKIWANVWSARMEYILRNSFLTLAQSGNATFSDVLKILVDRNYREKIVSNLNDPTLTHFWKNEYDKMPEKLQKEAIAPIQNKVGQFVTSPMIRRIIDHPKGSISIEKIMDEGKILLANLSQGRLGEDNAALLGATIITKIQIAAMKRVDMDEDKRRDFYLYVDEFQNFATSSFIKILSEARKYHLNLMLANQYMAQIPDDVRQAILGNTGTIISFAAGASDAEILHKEFAEVFTVQDLVNLSNFQIAIKMMIDGQGSRPFLARTLPLPNSKNQNKNTVINVSRQRNSFRTS